MSLGEQLREADLRGPEREAGKREMKPWRVWRESMT